MLSRYTMKRGTPARLLPTGIRQDTRMHTKHPLRPEKASVQPYLDAPSDESWTVFRASYIKTLETRFAEDRSPFDRLAALASDEDVWLGCSCPTSRNPEPGRCHTYLALQFMREAYPSLDVRVPDDSDTSSQ